MAKRCWIPRVAIMLGTGCTTGDPVFTEVAREFVDGVGFLDASVPPALAADGTVAFVAETLTPSADEAIFFGDGTSLASVAPASEGVEDVRSVQINTAGDVVYIADRDVGGVAARGVYATHTTDTSTHATIYEAPLPTSPGAAVHDNVALSESGMVGFSTIVNAAGAIYRAQVSGGAVVELVALREGSGVFYNTRELDVSDAGAVVVQMEYGDPTMGLARGLLVFDSPGDTLASIETAVEKQGIGVQPQPASNAAGQVAFALATNVSMTFYDPPDDVTGTVVAVVDMVPGVYIANPTAFGQPPDVMLVADTSGGYASFGRVRINDAGQVAFEAALDGGGFGIFDGPDPVADKLVAVGDTMGDLLFSWVRLGELNHAGQISVFTSDFNSTDRQVWRIERDTCLFGPPGSC